MKIISYCIGVVTCCSGVRVPSKDICFARANKVKKGKTRNSRYFSTPKNDDCISESSRNPCLASKIVKSLKKIHKKIEREIHHCSFCIRDQILSDNVRRRIICKTNDKLMNLCVFARDLNCPRVIQAEAWLKKCRYLKHKMMKCKNHRSFVSKMKEKTEIERKIINQILI